MKLIFHSQKNPHSHMTAKERGRESFPVRYLIRKGLIKGRVLDFGCGLGSDAKFLRQKDITLLATIPIMLQINRRVSLIPLFVSMY
jgi:hypothetical protein